MNHRGLSQWHSRLAQSLESGVSLIAFLKESRGPGGKSTREMGDSLEQGNALDTVLENAPAWLPQADRMMLSAGAQAGRLPQAAHVLSQKHQHDAENHKEWMMALLYPLFLIHLAIILNPIMSLLSQAFAREGGETSIGLVFVKAGLVPLAIFWAVLLGGRMVLRRFQSLRLALIRLIPGLAGYARNRATARFAGALDGFLEAGTPVAEAYGGAALVADYPPITRPVLGILDDLKQGKSPGPILAQRRVLRDDWMQLFLTGEKTGRLPTNLNEIRNQADREALHRLKAMRFWYANLIYLAIAVYIGIQVTSAFGEYLDMLEGISTDRGNGRLFGPNAVRRSGGA